MCDFGRCIVEVEAGLENLVILYGDLEQLRKSFSVGCLVCLHRACQTNRGGGRHGVTVEVALHRDPDDGSTCFRAVFDIIGKL